MFRMKFLISSMRIICFIVLSFGSTAVLMGQSQSPVVMIFAGDVTLAQHIETAVGDRTEYIFQHWLSLKPYDVFMVNLENPITTSEERVKKEFNFKMPEKYIRILQHGGVNIVNAANNHLADYGRLGIYDTIRNLDSASIRYVGIGRNLREARTPVIKTINGRTIGFLGYHGGEDFAATTDSAGLAPRYKGYVVGDVRRLRPKVDYVVVNFHWGEELAEFPDEWQIDLAHTVVDAGADLIVGHHPHILQGVEIYNGATIAYSLGNFVFGGNSRHTYDTAVIRVVLSESNPVVEVLPVTVARWQPRLAMGEHAERIVSTIQQRSSIFQDSLGFQPLQTR